MNLLIILASATPYGVHNDYWGEITTIGMILGFGYGCAKEFAKWLHSTG